jgi:acetyl-CoA acyltransferase 1
VKDKSGESKEVRVLKDDGIIEDAKLESLQKLKAAFKQGGTTTAGNSSQVTDGAAEVLLMRRSVALKNGSSILGRIVGYSVAGVPPEIMGIGPAFAIPKVLEKTGLKLDDIGIFELNEAFASQANIVLTILKSLLRKLTPEDEPMLLDIL